MNIFSNEIFISLNIDLISNSFFSLKRIFGLEQSDTITDELLSFMNEERCGMIDSVTENQQVTRKWVNNLHINYCFNWKNVTELDKNLYPLLVTETFQIALNQWEFKANVAFRYV